MPMDRKEKAELVNNAGPSGDPNSKPSMGNDKPAKKRRGMSLLRAALLVLRRRSKKTPIHHDVTETGKKGLFKSLFASMRPLHHQPKLEKAPRTPPEVGSQATAPETPRVREREVFLPPPSPCGSEAWFSADGMSSRYASSDDLRALDTYSCDEGEIEEADGAGDGTPNAIDLKAEEFIAMFYAQMRLQSSDSVG